MRLLLILLTVSGLVSGCSTSKEALLPAGETTMLALWQNKAAAHNAVTESRNTLRRGLSADEKQAQQILAENYSRTSENEISQIFPRLPNPDLVMYVYPHLTGNGSTPVPGYSTVFSFYTQIHYALPGERIGEL